MAKIKHIAVFSPDPKKLAEFYRDVFGMEIKGYGSHGDAWVTDGYIDFAILPHFEHTKPPIGIHHFGITIEPDEKEAVYEKLAALQVTVRPPPDDGIVRPYAEDQMRDIEGNPVDISTAAMALDAEGKPISKKAKLQPA